MPSTSGPCAGDGARPRATWSSCAMPTTSSSDSSTKLTPDASWMRCVSGCGSLRCRFILRRPGSLSSDASRRNAASGAGSANRETFNFLGFTFICGKTHAGKFQVKRKTRRDRMLAKLRMVKEEMRGRMHQPIAVQGKWLWYVVRGYFNYHAVPTNSRALVAFRTEIAKSGHRVLIRRGELTSLNWTRMNRLIDEWLPKPRILHPWPDKRFAVTHPR